MPSQESRQKTSRIELLENEDAEQLLLYYRFDFGDVSDVPFGCLSLQDLTMTHVHRDVKCTASGLLHSVRKLLNVDDKLLEAAWIEEGDRRIRLQEKDLIHSAVKCGDVIYFGPQKAIASYQRPKKEEQDLPDAVTFVGFPKDTDLAEFEGVILHHTHTVNGRPCFAPKKLWREAEIVLWHNESVGAWILGLGEHARKDQPKGHLFGSVLPHESCAHPTLVTRPWVIHNIDEWKDTTIRCVAHAQPQTPPHSCRDRREKSHRRDESSDESVSESKAVASKSHRRRSRSRRRRRHSDEGMERRLAALEEIVKNRIPAVEGTVLRTESRISSLENISRATIAGLREGISRAALADGTAAIPDRSARAELPLQAKLENSVDSRRDGSRRRNRHRAAEDSAYARRCLADHRRDHRKNSEEDRREHLQSKKKQDDDDDDTWGTWHGSERAISATQSKQESKICRPCPGNCGYQITWHDTHCCGKCSTNEGHGMKCEKVLVVKDDMLDSPPVYQRRKPQLPRSPVSSSQKSSPPRRRQSNRVTLISWRTGWFVDSVDFHMSDGDVKHYADPSKPAGSGEATDQISLKEGEYIESVEQTNTHVGYLGASLTFNLSTGRSIAIKGSSGHKVKSSETKTAPAQHYVHGLRFDGSTLAELLTQRL